MRIPNSPASLSLILFGSSLAVLGGAIVTVQEIAPKPTAEQVSFFETKIRPVLANNCFGCHGPTKQSSSLRLDSRAALIKGGDTGPAIDIKNPDKSLLLTAVHQTGDLKMPPGKKLAGKEIADLESWIKMGAPWPLTGKGPTEKPPLWSIQPVKMVAPPKVKNAKWVRNPIDAYVLAGMEKRGLSPSAEADRRTLLRRLSYDLTGLPPTADEVMAFVSDKSPQAYEKVVDRLLASPRYGERWARLWLDVARYSDTKGYVFVEDRNYYNAYTYREWVINSFNGDLPYDQFIKQQLAADRLPEVRDGDDKRALAALGFLTIGRRFLNSQPDIIDDRIDVTMRGFQGLTVACSRCHDHKFDPIPTEDYYSLYGVFASTDEATEPISEPAIRDPWRRHNAQLSKDEGEINSTILSQVASLRKKEVTPQVKGVLQTLREGEMPDAAKLAKLRPSFDPAAQTRMSTLEAEVAQLKKNAPPTPEFAMAMMDRPNPGDHVIFRRGNPGNRGPIAPRRFLAALAKPGAERDRWTKGSGRIELAESIASKSNPLTARVFVNRVWMHHFGAGLVRTPSDFGYQGEKPTHPELLDYLAQTFMDQEWSIKRLHRTILLSATYRQSADVTSKAYNADPENRTWSRMNRRRLDLEQTRDTLLAASGKLDLSRIGGKSVDLWEAPFNPRRAVYGFIERQNLPGIFRTFDFASPDSTSARRFQTTVPQQALFFMNSALSTDQARTIAGQADLVQAKDDAQRVRRLYLRLFARLPDKDELSAGLAYLGSQGLSPAHGIDPSWQYGYGAFDAVKNRTTSFTPLAHYSKEGYRVSAAFPDPQLGYLLLNAQGGHPGNDPSHSVIRRWIAPESGTISISGVLKHPDKQGDGVIGRIVSSRTGLIREWMVFNRQVRTDLKSFLVQKGETIDFIVDPVSRPDFDGFNWAPTIKSEIGTHVWSASSNFGPPPGEPMTRLALYAQALMMTNEFLFVD